MALYVPTPFLTGAVAISGEMFPLIYSRLSSSPEIITRGTLK